MSRRFSFEWNWWAINRPHLNCGRVAGHWWVTLSWGTGNSDPVWSISFEGGKR